MTDPLLLRRSRTVLLQALGLSSTDRLAILWDQTVSAELVDSHYEAAVYEGIETITVTYSPITRRPQREYCWFAGRSLTGPPEVPKGLAAAINAVDAVLLLSSDLDMHFSPVVHDYLSRGGRIVMLPYLDRESALRLLPEDGEEVQRLETETNRLADMMTSARTARVVSAQGTDLTLRLGTYKVSNLGGVAKPGQMQILPGGQVSMVPDESSANGVLVIDRTIADDDYRVLTSPITLEVSDGKVVGIKGEGEADRLRAFITRGGEGTLRHLTELGVGVNPRCRFSGVNAPAEDTHTLGTVSFALGCDVHIGGITKGVAHVDMTMRFPTLELDDAVVTRNGVLAVTRT
jgi:2,5-dihydroxypyridine 5,6-dioxygenase